MTIEKLIEFEIGIDRQFSDLPTSFIEKHFKEAIVIQQQPKNPKKEPVKCLQGSLTKSVIDNNPIFMIYTDYKNNSKNVNKIRKSLWRMPLPDRLKSIWWAYTWPIKLLLTLTVPNPKTYRRLYPITFLMCICWIGLNAYLICWMVTVIGMNSFFRPKIVSFFNWNRIQFSFLHRWNIQNKWSCNGYDIFGSRWLFARSYFKCINDSKEWGRRWCIEFAWC